MRAPANWGEAYRQKFDRIYRELAQAHSVALYPFFLDGVALDPELNQPDGLHPNARGVTVLVERIAPVVADLIRKPSGGHP
jgi:acyl-CoA thioesterase-1